MMSHLGLSCAVIVLLELGEVVDARGVVPYVFLKAGSELHDPCSCVEYYRWILMD